MRVPRFIGGGRIAFADGAVPEPGPGQLLVAVKANAVCGSERGQFFGGTGITPGHELAGVVAGLGPGTSGRLGTPGVAYLMDYCGECRHCRLGFTNQCAAKRGDIGFNRDGGYGPFALVGAHAFFPVPPELPLHEATLLLDIMGTGGHALHRAGLVHPDPQRLCVAGAGPMGLAVLAMAKLRFGPDFPVYMSDVAPYRLGLAEALGGIPVALGNGRTLNEGLAAAGGAQVDLAIDTSGRGAARQALLAVLDRRGVLVCVGHGEDLRLEVSPHLIAPERAVLGSEYFRFSELRDNLPVLLVNRPYLARIITHRRGIDELEAAMTAFFRGETGKVVIEQ